MLSLTALKQPLKHYLKMLVVLMIFASGFMFAVAETTRGDIVLKFWKSGNPPPLRSSTLCPGAEHPI